MFRNNAFALETVGVGFFYVPMILNWYSETVALLEQTARKKAQEFVFIAIFLTCMDNHFFIALHPRAAVRGSLCISPHWNNSKTAGLQTHLLFISAPLITKSAGKLKYWVYCKFEYSLGPNHIQIRCSSSTDEFVRLCVSSLESTSYCCTSI